MSIPLAAAFGFLFSALFGAHWEAIFAGFLVGYVIYDTTHYATHHWKMQSGLGRFLREYHLRHHFRDDDLPSRRLRGNLPQWPPRVRTARS